MALLLCCVSVRLTVPRRPDEVKLPAELLYEIQFNCSDAALVGDVRSAVQSHLQTRIHQHGTCSAAPTGCIVDNVDASCVRRRRRRQPSPDRLRQRLRRRKRRRRRRSRKPEDAASRSRRRRRRRRHFQDRKSRRGSDPSSSPPSPPVLAVQFSLATRLLGDGSPWPDDYHRAVYWLRTVYDDIEDQLSTGNFRLAQLEGSLEGLVTEVEDSLTEAPLETECGLGFEFIPDILLCGTTLSYLMIIVAKHFYRAMLAQSAVIRLHVVCLSVRLSVRNV